MSWTAVTSKGPAGFYIPGFLFLSALTVLQVQFPDGKTKVQKNSTLQFLLSPFLMHLTHQSKIPEIMASTPLVVPPLPKDNASDLQSVI